MHWVLQSNLFREAGYSELFRVLERLGLPHSVHDVVPFVGRLATLPDIDHKNVICMGSYSMRHTAREMGWSPGVFDLEPFPFHVQHARWGDNMLNSGSTIAPFRDVMLGQNMFVRPINDTKSFTAKVYDPTEFAEWQARVESLGDMPGELIDRNTLIQVAPIREIYREYRFWVVRGKIVCASLYKMGDTVLYSSDVPQSYYEFVDAMVAMWQPHDAFVIDVALVLGDDGRDEIKIVEINTINCAGFYAADIQKLVMSLDDAFDERNAA